MLVVKYVLLSMVKLFKILVVLEILVGGFLGDVREYALIIFPPVSHKSVVFWAEVQVLVRTIP